MTSRIKDLPSRTGSSRPSDQFPFGQVSPDVDRKITLANVLAGVGIATYPFGVLPGAGTAGIYIYVTDGRKVGEGAAAGTGVVCVSDGSNWKTVDAATTVTN